MCYLLLRTVHSNVEKLSFYVVFMMIEKKAFRVISKVLLFM